MELNICTIARTSEDINHASDDNALFILGGKAAGVCYMPEDYFHGKIQNEEAAVRRAYMTSTSGHHSVFEHGSVTLQISGLSKIMVMLLNSIEQYATSEKSARYTVMKPETELELEVYEKWRNIFKVRIAEVYPGIDPKMRSKLAMENARYLISIFTPTHMLYTVNYRQLAYIIGWLRQFSESVSHLSGEFNRRMAKESAVLADALNAKTTATEHIHDNKHRGFELMPYQTDGIHINDVCQIGDIYQVTYLSSFASLAHLHRHRTIHYEFDFSGDDAREYGVYVPPIIRGIALEQEWYNDFEKTAYCYPQGTLVKTLEQGRAIKFFDKCKERLCGRVLLETMEHCKWLLDKFLETDTSCFNDKTLSALRAIAPENKSVTKCAMSGVHCDESCIWGAKNGIDRLI